MKTILAVGFLLALLYGARWLAESGGQARGIHRVEIRSEP